MPRAGAETDSEAERPAGAGTDGGPDLAPNGVREAGNPAAARFSPSEKASLPRPSQGLLPALAENPKTHTQNSMKERQMGVVA